MTFTNIKQIATLLFKYFLLFSSIFLVGRITLFTLYFDKFKDVNFNYWLTFLHGFRMDTIISSIILLLPLLIISLFPKQLKNIANIIFKYYFLSMTSLILYVEVATIPFFDQYDVRPNFIFVEYIKFPKEIFAMIMKEYSLELYITIFTLLLFIFIYLKNYDKEKIYLIFEIPYKVRVALFVPFFLVLLLGARSSLGSRPANLSDALWSHNRTINEITKNSIHSVATDIYRTIKYKDNMSYAKQYGKIDTKEAFKRAKRLLGVVNIEDIYSTNRVVPTHFKTNKKKNLVIFLQESMGARFVEAVGGEKGITPHFNSLAKEGLLFSNIYSNGTRSNRAIVGVTTGMFSVPGKQLLKRAKASSGFFTIAQLLKPYGYHTSFIYGGEARFDNMKSFFMDNGFHNIIEGKDFKDSIFRGTWGVCDEDLVVKANEEFKKLYAKKQKFATLMFSMSSHPPYEFPAGYIKPYKGDEVLLKNGIKYADYAIGKFFELAKKEEYYKDTIFVVVADHNVRYKGNEMVPVNQFHIPGLILGENIKPTIYSKISSQPDILATALDMLGLDFTYPIMGHSIYSDKKQNMTLLQFHSSYALLKDDKVAILRPNKKPITFSYKNQKIKEIEHDRELEKDALSLVTIIDYMYNNRLYKLQINAL